MRCIRAIVVAAVVLVAGLALSFAGPAGATGEIVDVGWWTRLPTASAPEGGLNVGSGIDGPNSVAAIRFDLGDGMISLSLSLTEAGGAPNLAEVRACPAGDGWMSEEGGELEDAPDIDCTSSVVFERAESGTWTADVTPLISNQTGQISIGLQASGPTGSGMLGVVPSEVQFDAPSAFGAPAGGAAPTTEPTVPPTTAVSPSPQEPSTPTQTSPSPNISPSQPSLNLTPVDRVEVEADDVPTTAPAPPETEERALPLVAFDRDGPVGRPWGQAISLVFLSGLVGLLVGGGSWAMSLRT